MRFIRGFAIARVAITTIVMVCMPTNTASANSKFAAICNLDPIAVGHVLGVSGPDHYAGPEFMSGDSCTWRTTDPNCFLRVLSIRQHVTKRDRAEVANLLDQAKPFDRAPTVFGPNAFYAHTDLGPAAAIAIERIYVPRNDRSWLEVALSGRLGPDGSRELLVAAAKAIPRSY